MTIYYVSTSGNDSNSGTSIGSPWKTITKANSTLTAGDTVEVRGGTYSNQQIAPSNSGTSDSNRITYKAYQSEIPLLTHSTRRDVIVLSNRDYVTVDGFHANGGPGFYTDATIEAWGDFSNTSHCIFKNLDFRYCKGYSAWRFQSGSEYNQILDSSFDAVGYWDTYSFTGSHDDTGSMLFLGDGCDYNLIQGNTFTRGGHDLMRIESDYNVIKNNIWSNTFETYSGSAFSFKSGDVDPGDKVGNRAFSLKNVSNRNLIEGNWISAIPETVDNEKGSAIKMLGTANILRQNFFYDNTTEGAVVSTVVGSDDATIGVNNRFYHNNIFNCYGPAWNLSSNTAAVGEPVDNHFKNNIIYKMRQGSGIEWDEEFRFDKNLNTFYGNEFAGAKVQGNCVAYDSGATDQVVQKGTSAISLTAAESSYSSTFSDNIQADPEWASSTPADLAGFALQEGSPCAGAAVNLTTADGSGSGTSLTVDDASYFSDGFGIVPGDYIQIGLADTSVQISSINYNTNVITLATSTSWSDGDGINIPHTGTTADIGAVQGAVVIPSGDVSIKMFDADNAGDIRLTSAITEPPPPEEPPEEPSPSGIIALFDPDNAGDIRLLDSMAPHAADVNDIESSTSIDGSLEITLRKALTANDISSSTSLDSPVLKGYHNVVVNDAVSNPLADDVVLTAKHQLLVNGAATQTFIDAINIFVALLTGTFFGTNDNTWIVDRLAEDGNSRDLWIEFLNFVGFDGNSFNDLSFEWLESLGYGGSLGDKWETFRIVEGIGRKAGVPDIVLPKLIINEMSSATTLGSVDILRNTDLITNSLTSATYADSVNISDTTTGDITITGSVSEGATVSLSPTAGGFGTFGGVVRQYTKGDEAANGTAITYGTPSLGTQSLSTYVIGIGDDTSGQHLTFDTTQQRTGRTSSLRRKRYDSTTSTNRNGGFGYASSNHDPELFISYWRRFQSDTYSVASANWKQYYVFSDGIDGGLNETPQVLLMVPAGSSSWSFYDNTSNSVGPTSSSVYNAKNTEGWKIPDDTDWHRWDSHFKLNDIGVENGFGYLYRDNVKGVDLDACKWQRDGHDTPATGWDDVRIGHYDSGVPNAITDYTDVYIATTPARVEMGNASTWSACTHTELLPVEDTSWSDTSITDVVLDSGALTLSGSYLYVIKSDGTPFNENGEPL